MIYIDLSDKIIQRAKNKRISQYTKICTQCVLWGGLGYLIISGTMALTIVGEMLIIAGANKVTKKVIKNKFKKGERSIKLIKVGV